MTAPLSTRFRDWMEELTSPRGPEAEWPWLLRELLTGEYLRQREEGFAYTGDVFKDRDADDPTAAVLPEKRAVKDLFHLARRETAGVFRVGEACYWLLGYEWPNQGRDRGRRADLVGLNAGGGLVVFECKLAANSYGPFAAVLEGLDYLACLTAEANFAKIQDGFRRWVAKPSASVPPAFCGVGPTLAATPEVIVLAPAEYYGLYTRSRRGAGWQEFAALPPAVASLSLRFAVSDFCSHQASWALSG